MKEQQQQQQQQLQPLQHPPLALDDKLSKALEDSLAALSDPSLAGMSPHSSPLTCSGFSSLELLGTEKKSSAKTPRSQSRQRMHTSALGNLRVPQELRGMEYKETRVVRSSIDEGMHRFLLCCWRFQAHPHLAPEDDMNKSPSSSTPTSNSSSMNTSTAPPTESLTASDDKVAEEKRKKDLEAWEKFEADARKRLDVEKLREQLEQEKEKEGKAKSTEDIASSPSPSAVRPRRKASSVQLTPSTSSSNTSVTAAQQ